MIYPRQRRFALHVQLATISEKQETWNGNILPSMAGTVPTICGQHLARGHDAERPVSPLNDRRCICKFCSVASGEFDHRLTIMRSANTLTIHEVHLVHL